jgi:ribosomal protein L11 methyltransferase
MSGIPERWLELSARSASAGERAPLLADALLSLGGRASEEKDDWYVTHLPAPPDVDSFIEEARVILARTIGLEDVEVHGRVQEHEDWAQTWKRGLEPRRITDRIVVTPSWMDPHAGPGDLVIVVDPGMAFGNAEHGTTRGCLRLLDGVVQGGDRVLDIGAGSGILSIAAAMLGAGEVLAVEGDPMATETLRENISDNGCAGVVDTLVEWVDNPSLRALGPADGIVANIEAGILSPLLPGLRDALRQGGWLILSGILDDQWSELTEAAEAAGMRAGVVDADGEWRSGLFHRRV